jgi:hypothetical protein
MSELITELKRIHAALLDPGFDTEDRENRVANATADLGLLVAHLERQGLVE